jgi:hypothetical protein
MILDAWTLGEKLDQVWPRMRTLMFVLIGCLLAALLNPYGVRLFTFPLQTAFSPVFQQVVADWMSPNFHERELLPFVVLLFLTIAALVLSPKRARPSELLLFFATLYASLKAQRNIMIFALVAVPLLAKYSQLWLESTKFGPTFAKPPSSESSRRSNLILVVALLPLLLFAIKLKATVFLPPREQIIQVPVKAVEYLKEKQITGNTFTDVNIWGGYVIWALPSNPVYIDGRDVYPEQFVKEYLDIILGLTDWREPFSRYGVRIVIAQPKSVLGRELRESGEWNQVFQDESATVFVRK